MPWNFPGSHPPFPSNAPPSTLHIYPHGGHGWGRCTIGDSKKLMGKDAVCEWPGRAALFLKMLNSSEPLWRFED